MNSIRNGIQRRRELDPFVIVNKFISFIIVVAHWANYYYKIPNYQGRKNTNLAKNDHKLAQTDTKLTKCDKKQHKIDQM